MRKAILLGLAVVLALGISMSSGIPMVRAETVELKLAHFMPPVHVQHRKNFAPFAENVAKLSDGKVTVKIYPGGTLGGPKQLYDATRTGVTDIAFIIPSYVTGRFPRCAVFELPSLFDNAVHLTESAYRVYDQYIAEDFKDVKLLYMYAPGLGQLHSAGDPILSLDDMKGTKVRSPNALMTIALRKLGANPVGMPISKLAVSLQKGVIDGVLTPYSAITDFKLFDLVKHVTRVNLYGTFMCVVMNKKKWESLSEAGKKAILEAGGKQWGLHTAQAYDQHDLDTIETIKKEGKIKLHNMPDAELAIIQERLKDMYADWVNKTSKKGIPAQEILDAVREAAKKTR
jgi:TRAP-type C4-dicarboxylate transport system substrate-binding protein